MNNENDRPEVYKFPQPSASIIDENEGTLALVPGFNGVPVLGETRKSISTLKREELGHLFRQRMDGHFRIFDMSDEDDRKAYERLISAAASYPWVGITKETYPEGYGDKHWKISVKWFEGHYARRPDRQAEVLMTKDSVSR